MVEMMAKFQFNGTGYELDYNLKWWKFNTV